MGLGLDNREVESQILEFLLEKAGSMDSVDILADLCPGLRLQPVLEFCLVSIHRGVIQDLVTDVKSKIQTKELALNSTLSSVFILFHNSCWGG